MIQNMEALRQAREEAKKAYEACPCRILVCSGTECIATGSEKIYEKMMEIADMQKEKAAEERWQRMEAKNAAKNHSDQ